MTQDAGPIISPSSHSSLTGTVPNPSLGALFLYFRSTEEKIDCTPTVKWIDYQKQKTFSGTIVFDLEPRDEGLISINGILKDDCHNQTHHIRREIRVTSAWLISTPYTAAIMCVNTD